MKKLISFSLAAVISTASYAQLSVGVQGIGNLSSAKFELADVVNPTRSMRAMPGGGVVLQAGLGSVAIRTGVNFLQSGVKLKGTVPGGDNFEAATRINYVQLPVNLLYVAKAGGLQLYFGGGGYFNYAVSGQSVISGQVNGQPMKVTDDLFKSDDPDDVAFKRTDYGLSVLAGVRLPGGLFANVGYQYGLNNIGGDEDNVYKNRGLQLSIGYFFR